jgi:hypothetical protein
MTVKGEASRQGTRPCFYPPAPTQHLLAVKALLSVTVHLLVLPGSALGACPSLQELEAARSYSRRKLPKGRETRDYWYKFLAATERHTEDEIRAV